MRKTSTLAICLLLLSGVTKCLAQPLIQHHRNVNGTMDWGSYNTAKQYYEMQRKFNASRSTPEYKSSISYDAKADARKMAAEREIKARTVQIKQKTHTWRSDDLLLDQQPVRIEKYPDLYFVRKSGKWGVLHFVNRELIAEPAYTNIIPLQHNCLLVVKGKDRGVITTNGQFSIPVGKYQKIEQTGTLFLVQAPDGNYGVVDGQGKTLHNTNYKNGLSAFGNIVLLDHSGKSLLINPRGVAVLSGTGIDLISPQLAIGKKDETGYFAFYHPSTGAAANPDRYDYMEHFWKNNFVLAGKDNRYLILDKNGKPISGYRYDEINRSAKDPSVYITVAGTKKGLLDVHIEQHVTEVLPPLYDAINSFDRAKGTAAVILNGEEKQVPLELFYGAKSIGPFKEGIARVFNGKSYYYINRQGGRLSDLFDKGSEPESDKTLGLYAMVETGEKKGHWFFASRSNTGDLLLFDDITMLERGLSEYSGVLSKVKKDGKWGVVQYQKNEKYSDGTFNHTMREFIPCSYDNVEVSANDQLIFLKEQSKWGAVAWPASWQFSERDVRIPFRYDKIERIPYNDYLGKAVYFKARTGKKSTFYRYEKSRNGDKIIWYGKTETKRVPSSVKSANEK